MDMKDNLIALNTCFNDYMFYEDEHYYTYRGKRVKFSVTQFTGTKHKEFDKDKMSAYVAKRDSRSQEEVLKDWDNAAKLSCNVGTLFHLRSEQLANNKTFEIDFRAYQELEFFDLIKDRLAKLIPMQDEFFRDIHNKLIPIKTEFTVGYKDIIAGNIDLLAWNEKDQEFQIWDYKTNKDIKTENKYQKLLDEFNFLDDCELNKYSIQLGIYKDLLERTLDIRIGKCYLAWFNENNDSYKIFKCLDLKESIHQCLDNLIRKEEINGNNTN